MPLKAAPVWALLGPGKERPESWGVRVDVANLATASVTKMYIYGEIGYWGVEANDVVEALSSISGPVEVHINSMGGSVFEGLAIYQALVEHAGGVDVVIDGLAASAASFIAMAGRTISIGQAAHMMIHNASSGCYGDAAAMEAQAIMLRNCSTAIAGLYAKRSGQSLDTFTAAMDAETWYIGQEAVDAGLADSVRGEDADEPMHPEHPMESKTEPVINLAALPDPPVVKAQASADEPEGGETGTAGDPSNENSSPSEDVDAEEIEPGDDTITWDHVTTPTSLFGHLPVAAGLFDHLMEGAAQ